MWKHIVLFILFVLLSVDSGATEMACSLPKTVPESPTAHQPRTPRTPRTPGRQDPNKTPRFYPVMKESGNFDDKVSSFFAHCLDIQGGKVNDIVKYLMSN